MFGFGKKRAAEVNTGLPDGIYRQHRQEDVEHFTQLAVDAFPDLAGRVRCFGADWLGRQFASDAARGGEVLLIEPGTGELLEIPVDVETFHAEELVEQADAAAALFFYREWLAAGGAVPGYDQCIGYKVPLFLGGADTPDNLELGDFDVYWTVCAQLLAQSR